MKALLSPREMAELATSRRTPSPAPTPPVDVMNCSEDGRITLGIRDAFSVVYRQLGWERLLGARLMDANRIIQELVLARIAQPQSNRVTVREWYDHGTMPSTWIGSIAAWTGWMTGRSRPSVSAP